METSKHLVDLLSLMESSPLVYELYDSKGNVIEVNKAALDLFGVESFEESKNYNFFHEPNLKPEILEKARRKEYIRFKMDFDFDLAKEKKVLKSSKTGKIYLDVTITPLTFLKREEFYYLIHIQDITEFVKMHQNLVLRERQYSLLFDHLIGGFFYFQVLFDNNGQPDNLKILETNQFIQRKLNLPRHEIINQKITDLVPDYLEKNKDFVQTLFDCALNGKEIYEERYSYLLQGWYHYTIYSPLNGYVAIIFNNIDEKKKNERMLNQKYNLLRQSLENAPIPLIIIEPEGKIILGNSRFAFIAGINDTQLPYKNFFDLLDPSTKDAFIQAIQENIRASRAGFSLKAGFKNPQNCAAEYYIQGSIIPFETEKTTSIVLTFSLTNRKSPKEIKIVSSLQAIHQELEDLILDMQFKDSEAIFENKINEKIKPFDFSKKELGLIQLILRGTPNKKIALQYFVSEITVKKWVAEIYRKVGVKNREELADFLKK